MDRVEISRAESFLDFARFKRPIFSFTPCMRGALHVVAAATRNKHATESPLNMGWCWVWQHNMLLARISVAEGRCSSAGSHEMGWSLMSPHNVLRHHTSWAGG
jgi:hypothetical protein